MVSQLALLLAVHVQALTVAETDTALPVLGPGPKDALDGDNVKAHETPDCVIVNVCPAIVSVPERALVAALIA